MAKGIAAFVVMLGITMAISILAGIGFYDSLGLDYSDPGYDDDVQAAAQAMTTQEASNTGSSVFTDFTVGAGNSVQTFWQVLSNTSGVVKLLFGLPDIIANQIQTLFQITFGITFVGLIRGVLIG